MKRVIIILLFCLGLEAANAQVAFKTIIPQQAIVVGESFQVQYTLEDGEEVTNLRPPSFSPFRLVSGPNIYHGSVATIHGVKPLENIVYTLAATRPGRYIIHGATATSEGEIIKSNDGVIDVITREEASKRFNREAGMANTEYILKPGEDPYEKVRENLFLKVMVDRTSCYIGEPVLATFKLYSRLESKSDIVKNPGFYGFSVYDMVNLSDKFVTREKVNGKVFDVHTIRKVQLYPLQAGDFTIDAMEVKNKVEFSRSAVNKKTEQEIVEGVLGYPDEKIPDDNMTVLETDMHTEPVLIHVKPVPAKTKPAGFNGAVGDYTIRATVLKQDLARNEEGMMEVTLEGKGNFIQVSAPAIQWPEGMEGFDPGIKDRLNRATIPLEGQRIFRYVFVASRAGSYIFPSIGFTFFNPDSGTYKTISTQPLKVNISTAAKKTDPVTGAKSVRSPLNRWWIAAGLLVLATVGTIAWWTRKNHEKKKRAIPDKAGPPNSVHILLLPVYQQLGKEDKQFFSALHDAYWNFFREKFNLYGSEMKKENLLSLLKKTGIAEKLQQSILEVLGTCESGMFTNASLALDKENFLERAKGLLLQVESSL